MYLEKLFTRSSDCRRVSDDSSKAMDRDSLDLLRAYGISEEEVRHAGELRRAMELWDTCYCANLVTRESMEELMELRQLLLAFGLPESQAAKIGHVEASPHGSQPVGMPSSGPVLSAMPRSQVTSWRTTCLEDIQE